jgi:1,2-phenylacetyl-CoA epoxidase catalytic subunit
MAQDELGHARSTYPLVKQLDGVDADGRDHGLDAPPIALIGAELPDWSTFIAVNLVVDGALSAIVRAARESAFAPLAQRAAKILQEEEAHRIHASAWTARIGRGDAAEATHFGACVSDAWAETAGWLDEVGDDLSTCMRERLLDADGPQLVDRLRRQFEATLAGAGVACELAEPRVER